MAPDWLDICPIQLPAREGRLREPPCVNLRSLVDTMAAALEPHFQRPYALLGYSLGGLLSFELTRALRARRAPLPARLLVAAARAPQVPRPFSSLARLSDEAFLAELGRRYNGLRPEVWENRQLRAMILPALRGDFEMLENYQYAAATPLEVAISAFAGESDPVAPPAEVERWQEQTTGEFALRVLGGGHFFLPPVGETFVSAVFAELRRTAESRG